MLLRLRLQEVCIEFDGGEAVLSASAVLFGAVNRELRKALAEAPASAL